MEENPQIKEETLPIPKPRFQKRRWLRSFALAVAVVTLFIGISYGYNFYQLRRAAVRVQPGVSVPKSQTGNSNQPAVIHAPAGISGQSQLFDYLSKTYGKIEFGQITSYASSSYNSLPTELQGLVPKTVQPENIQQVSYKNGKSGYVISYVKDKSDSAALQKDYQAFMAQVSGEGLTILAGQNAAAFGYLDFETANYQVRYSLLLQVGQSNVIFNIIGK